mmetsp:Transcript_14307/g.42692  ORF Transcript_14307/g.42692 Transcript_14307/m.42692 type:complete len:644 (-) Transcript_14307:165-2096(-)
MHIKLLAVVAPVPAGDLQAHRRREHGEEIHGDRVHQAAADEDHGHVGVRVLLLPALLAVLGLGLLARQQRQRAEREEGEGVGDREGRRDRVAERGRVLDVVGRVRERRVPEAEHLVRDGLREGPAEVRRRRQQAVDDALVAALGHLDDDERAHDKVRGRRDLDEHRLAEVEVLVAHDVEDGAEGKRHVHDVQKYSGNRQHPAPRRVQEMGFYQIEPGGEEREPDHRKARVLEGLDVGPVLLHLPAGRRGDAADDGREELEQDHAQHGPPPQQLPDLAPVLRHGPPRLVRDARRRLGAAVLLHGVLVHEDDPRLRHEEPGHGHHGQRGHREQAHDARVRHAPGKGAVVLPRVHAQPDDGRGHDVAQRAHEVDGRLRLAPPVLGLEARERHREAVGGHVGDAVPQGREHHQERVAAARLGRLRVAGPRGFGDAVHHVRPHVAGALGVDAPVGLRERHEGQPHERRGAGRPSEDHVGLAPVAKDGEAVVDRAEDELEGPGQAHDGGRGGVDVALHVQVAQEEAVDGRGQAAVHDADREVLQVKADELAPRDCRTAVLRDLLGVAPHGHGALDGRGEVRLLVEQRPRLALFVGGGRHRRRVRRVAPEGRVVSQLRRRSCQRVSDDVFDVSVNRGLLRRRGCVAGLPT